MRVNFTHIHIENFCAIERLDADLGDRTIVSGKNAVGKSTVKKAIQFVLNVRDENGKEILGIRPHNKNGIDIDGLVTAVELTVSADGAENVLRKEFYQKKNRKGEYTGENDTIYYIDGVKKGTKKAYDEFVQSLIPNEVCINANVLLAKDTSGRREMLKAFEKHTAEDVIAENPQFEELRGKLKANSVADIKASLRKKISGTKGRNAEGGLEDELKRIGIEIEVEQGKKCDIDVAELELARNDLNRQIAEIEAKEADISKQYEEYWKLSDGILELKFKLNGLQQKANEDCNKRHTEIQNKIGDKKFLTAQTERTIDVTENEIDNINRLITADEEIIATMREEYKNALNLEFDENSLVCAYCGQEYTSEKKEQIRAEFADKKAKQLEAITKEGNNAKTALERERKALDEKIEELLEHRKSLDMLHMAIADLEKQLSDMPEKGCDISDTEEYKAIQSQIVEKEAAMKQGNSADEIRSQLAEQKADLQSQLVEVNTQIALANENVAIDERIDELQKQRREVAQQIADVERELDLLKDFERIMMQMIETDVNSYFDFCEVRMADTYLDGATKDICEFFRNGTAYFKGLNYSDRMLVEVDICRAFQKLQGIECAIIVDNTESLDSDRVPDVSNQLILLKRTDDSKLMIKSEENYEKQNN